MTLTPSNMLALGTTTPNFNLVNTVDNTIISPATHAKDKPLLVAFICNHCPYVIHILDQFTTMANTYQQKNIATIAISANDITTHPEDAPDKMKTLAKEKGFLFPYCFDESQQTAKDFNAACTPEFYLFNAQHKLIYRGRFDASKPNSTIGVTGNELQAALDAALQNPTNNNRLQMRLNNKHEKH